MNQLREQLAALEHEQWVQWSKTLAELENLSPERVARWEKLWVPYEELSEEVKEADRVWADKVIALLWADAPGMEEARQYIEEKF